MQIVLYLLKAYGIRKVIASPGTTNLTLVASMQQDPFFEMYSSVDERSAAYIACGLAAESGEPVVITCTGATASRNYYPGLTEAYYRKLPVIAITATQDPARLGHNIPQVIDRRQHAKDVVVLSEHIQYIERESDEWDVTIKVNKAMRALKYKGGGPIHLNLETRYSKDFSVKELPSARVIKYIDANTVEYPQLPDGKIGIFVGAHHPMSESLTDAINRFCASHDAIVLCYQASNYRGKYRVYNSLVGAQDDYFSPYMRFSLLIHIGDMSGCAELMRQRSDQQWRVSEDGKTCDTFRKLTAVFEMPEEFFFNHYAAPHPEGKDSLAKACQKEYADVLAKVPELPFSNLWVAQQTTPKLPAGCALHLGILNTLRSWNFFNTPDTVTGFSNTGGFGIDGDVSSLIGSSLANPDKIYIGVVGDLAFFYDLNSMGNRHVGNNVRIMLINNGRGVEFRNPYHPCNAFGEDADPYMAAAGHYGNQSHELVKHYATDLGYEYMSADNKEEFNANIGGFLSPQIGSKPIIFEVFTQVEDEKNALRTVHHLVSDGKTVAKNIIKKVLPDSAVEALKKLR